MVHVRACTCIRGSDSHKKTVAGSLVSHCSVIVRKTRR